MLSLFSHGTGHGAFLFVGYFFMVIFVIVFFHGVLALKERTCQLTLEEAKSRKKHLKMQLLVSLLFFMAGSFLTSSTPVDYTMCCIDISVLAFILAVVFCID